MNRGIRKVRHSIRRRKKRRDYNETSPTKNYSSLLLPETEEKHGVFPTHVNHHHQSNSRENKFRSTIWLKGIMSLFLFSGLTFLLQTNSDHFQKPQQWAQHYLNEEFPFAKVNDWYQTTFGSPLALLPEDRVVDESGDGLSLPVMGNVTETFTHNGKGIMISPTERTAVSAFNRGVVIFAGNDRQTKRTVTIQHPDKSKTTYGFLSSIDVHLYQIVNTNQRIGSFYPTTENETVYFSIEQNNSFIDPIQVIQVDTSP